MDYLQLAILSLIQGITEFLPISSSAHLLLPHHLLGWKDQGLAFDTAVHLGSLFAVLSYFRTDIVRLMSALTGAIMTKQQSSDSRFAIFLIIASLPVLIVGYFSRTFVESNLRSLEVITLATFVFAIALLVADLTGRRQRDANTLQLSSALLIGLSQCVALIPGASRSGVTMTMALMLGFTREGASRISFMIAIPAIASACLLKISDLMNSGQSVDWLMMLTGGLIAAVSAYLCVRLFLGLIEKIGFLPFIVYRLILSSVLFFMMIRPTQWF